MATLQDQLGLGLAIKQTQQQNNKQDYSYSYEVPGSTNKGIAFGMSEPGTMSTAGAGIVTQPTQDAISAPGVASRSFSASAPLSSSATTASVTNNTVDSLSGVQNGVVNKKKRNIAESTTQASMNPLAPVETPPTQSLPDMSGFREATAGQDVQFRQSYRDALKNPVAPIEPVAPVDATGLSGAELQAYNMLTPQEQQTYKALATQGLKAQTDYLTKSKANVEFEKSQEEKRLQMEDNTDAISDMNSQRNIEEAQRSVANLKQNIGYLGTGGQPGVSSQKLDAVSNQVTLADRTLKNIIEAERLSKVNRELGQEKNSEIFTRQMKILQDDLDGKVNKTVQSALNEFTSAELAGKLDTIPEIEAFQQQLYAQLDGDLSSIMDTNIEARKFLIERYDKLAESQKTAMANKEKADAEALKRKNTLNKDMSQALGYYVNENGEALTDRITGQNIVVPPESDVTYDKDSGQMVILTKNRDGTVGVQLKQVGTPKSTSTYQKIGTNPDTGEDVYGFVNAQQGTVTPYSGTMGTSGSQVNPQSVTPQAITSISPRLQGNNVQCGMVTNDYSANKFPDAPRMGNTYESKMNTINSIGISNNPQVGGLFVMNTGTSTGHTGIVQSVNGDGTFTATDANAEGSPDGGPVKTSTYNIGPKTTFSVAPQSITEFNENKDATYKAYLESGKLPTGMKEGTTRGNNFIDQATAWKEANPEYVSKDEKRDLAGIQNNIATDARRKDYLALSSKSKTLTGIQERLANGTATPQDKQQLVNDFAKILDPTSVVREGEYALAGKYSQSKIDSMKQEISNYFSTNGPLSDDAAKMLAEGVARRHIAIKQANDEAIDEGLANAKYLLGRDIPPEGVGAKYSDINLKPKIEAAKKKLGSISLSDILSKLN